MLTLSHKIPHECYLAYSGGSDSSALLHFANHPKRKLTLVYIYYTDYEHVYEEYLFVSKMASKLRLSLITKIALPAPEKVSKEAWWSSQRNNFFQQLDKPVITAHHLDDALEWWIMTSTKGDMKGKLVNVVNRNIIRPILFTKKTNIERYIEKHGISFFRDISNSNTVHPRNRIRTKVIPELVLANPGIYTSLLNRYKGITNDCINNDSNFNC